MLAVRQKLAAGFAYLRQAFMDILAPLSLYQRIAAVGGVGVVMIILSVGAVKLAHRQDLAPHSSASAGNGSTVAGSSSSSAAPQSGQSSSSGSTKTQSAKPKSSSSANTSATTHGSKGTASGATSTGGSGTTKTSNPPPATGCALPKYPNPDCTGVPAGTSLATIAGDVHLDVNQTLVAKHVTGSVYIDGSGANIADSQIDGGVTNGGHGAGNYASYTITDSTVGPASGCKDSDPEAALSYANFTASRVLIRGSNHGVQVEGSNAVVQDSFIQVCAPAGAGDHADGVLAYNSGSNVRILHTTIDMTQTPVDEQTSPIFDTGNAPYFDLENSLLLGGTYSIRLYDDGGSAGSYVVKDNVVANNSWIYGPDNADCSAMAPWSTSNAYGNEVANVNGSYQITGVVRPLYCAT